MEIAVLGFGTVGSGVVELLDHPESRFCSSMHVKHILVRSLKGRTDPRLVTDYNRIRNDKTIDTVMECMGGDEPAFTYVKQAIEAGRNVISSNKKMLALHLDELLPLCEKHHVQLFYEAACGGGIPWLVSLRHIRSIEPIQSFRGILNGTTNYILDAMTHSTDSFEESLSKAQKAGYAEADPTDDYCGYDIRYKLVLSAAEAYDVMLKIDSIITFGIQNLQRRDINYALAHHRTIKMIGETVSSGNGISAMVAPVMIPQTDPFAGVKKNLNAISCKSEALGVLTLEGQGAGSLPTAHAMVEDAVMMVRSPKFPREPIEKEDAVPSRERKIWYIRSRNVSRFRGKIREDLDNDTILTYPSTLSEIKENVDALEDPAAFVMEVS